MMCALAGDRAEIEHHRAKALLVHVARFLEQALPDEIISQTSPEAAYLR